MPLSAADLRSAKAPEHLLAYVRAVAPAMAIGEGLAINRSADGEHDDTAEAAWLTRDGYAVLPPTSGDPPRTELADAIVRLVESGLPAVFAYVFDEAWVIGEALRARVSQMTGAPYLLAADGWAWVVPPGTGRGWAPHRDDGRLLERHAPERINVWMALSDATAERACMYVVPLDEDPSYPPTGGVDAAPLSSVRAVPVTAGTAIAWNANLLHWGGGCSARARGPRIAISYTVVRADAAQRLGLPLMSAEALAPLGRIDLVATLIQSYEKKGLPDVSPEIAAWALATASLSAQIEALLPARAASKGTPP
jgi:hypothetical protein